MSKFFDRVPAPIRDHLHKWRTVYGIGFVLVIFLIFYLIYIFSAANNSSGDRSMSPQAFASSSEPLSTPTAQPSFSGTPQVSNGFVDGSQWKVKTLLGESTVDGYRSLDIMFENVSTGQTASGHCQSKHDPHPEVNDIYILTNTGYKDEYGRQIWLFSPRVINKVEVGIESRYQRFRLTQ